MSNLVKCMSQSRFVRDCGIKDPAVAAELWRMLRNKHDKSDRLSIRDWWVKLHPNSDKSPPMRTTGKLLDIYNALVDNHGIEAIRSASGEWDVYYCDAVALYSNTGDAYGVTLLYDVEAEGFRLTSWGDHVEWLERHGVRCV